MEQLTRIHEDGSLLGAALVAEALSVDIEGQAVLDGVSIAVDHGEVVALLGRDGAGKTVCFEALAGLTALAGGRIFLGGEDVTDLNVEERAGRGLAYLPEEVCIFRGMTVAENIATALEMVEPEEGRSARLDQMLRDFGLERFRDQSAATLSGGERRRCEIARAMAMQPAVLMLDEPFRGLDPMVVQDIRGMIEGLKVRHVGVLVSDYDLHDLLEIIDRAYVLHEGRLMFSGTPEALLADPEVRRFYLGETFVV